MVSFGVWLHAMASGPARGTRKEQRGADPMLCYAMRRAILCFANLVRQITNAVASFGSSSHKRDSPTPNLLALSQGADTGSPCLDAACRNAGTRSQVAWAQAWALAWAPAWASAWALVWAMALAQA